MSFPSVDGALITSALTHSNIAISGLAIDGSTGGGTLTIITHHNLSASQNVGSAVADFVQTNATQVHPHWSWTPNGTQVALTMACYIEGDPIEPATDRQSAYRAGAHGAAWRRQPRRRRAGHG